MSLVNKSRHLRINITLPMCFQKHTKKEHFLTHAVRPASLRADHEADKSGTEDDSPREKQRTNLNQAKVPNTEK